MLLTFYFVAVSILLLLTADTVYADSSWVWLTDTQPFALLPVATVLTITIEVVVIRYLSAARPFRRVLLVVTLANAVSFLLPYVILWLENQWYGSFSQILSSGPYYIVGGFYLLLTLILELPLTYGLLRGNTEHQRKLVFSIVLSNVLTTGMVALMERMLTAGHF